MDARRVTLPLLLLVSAATSQVINLWCCPKPAVKANFDAAQYTGLWWEVQRYDPIFFEIGTTCGQANYTLNDDGSIRVQNRGYIPGRTPDPLSGIVGEASAADPSQPAKLTVRFPTVSIFATGPYWVFDTDYTSYAVVYSCTQIIPLLIHVDIVWVLGRNKTLPDATLSDIRTRLAASGVRLDPLVNVTAENCPY